VEHAFLEVEGEEADGSRSRSVQPVGHVQVNLVNDLNSLTLEVVDDGSGLPEGFDIDASESLGLSIVRDLVRSQLEGTITMRSRNTVDPGQPGTVVAIELPPVQSDPQRAGL
jgi:two-component sensor histidine kinase